MYSIPDINNAEIIVSTVEAKLEKALQKEDRVFFQLAREVERLS
jgi:hypothetical protein